MKISLEGRLRNFSLGVEKPLMPLFEAIINSIHAIAEGKIKEGKITIKIHRDTHSLIDEKEKNLYPIVGFTIEDNGIGFTDKNFESFSISDSMYKHKIGGKGVGRFTWLKVFEKVEIDSVFKEGSQRKRRQFSFSINEIQNEQLEDVDDTEPCLTKITFSKIVPKYQKNCPKTIETIIRKIIEHFLIHFSITRVPIILVLDDEENSYDLNEEFEKKIKLNFNRQHLPIGTHRFTLRHFLLRAGTGDTQHNIHFCVHNRSVEVHDLKTQNSIFQKPFQDDKNNSFVYSCFVSSKFFDEQIDQTRTKIDLIDKSELLDELSREAILNKIGKCAEKYLENILKPIKEKNKKRVLDYIQEHPRYRPIIGSRPHWIEQLNGNYTNEELNIELFKLLQKLESEVIQEGEKIQKAREQKTTTSLEEEKKQFNKYIEETNMIGQSKLAEYVIHRKAVINIIKNSLKISDDGTYPYEDAIHDIIFPMGKTSNTIRYEEQSNLWMIDDRLSFHYCLASDKNIPQKKLKPDITIYQPFDHSYAFVDSTTQPFNSITIVEFKRPMRDDYKKNNLKTDPIDQVLNYADLIRKGQIKDENGTLIRVSEGTQIYAYVICDITPSMLELVQHHQLSLMADGLGYYGWHINYKVYTEVIDYKKLIQDAEKRNQVFFNKLGM
jgi:hypothetical protein